MKKIIVLAFACLGIAGLASAQTKPIVAMPSKPVITSKVPVVKPFPEKKFYVVKGSRTTNNYNSNTQIRVWMDYTDNIPYLKWESSSPISKIVMNFKNGSNSTWGISKEGETSGYFMMSSGAYANKGTYLIEFYEKGHLEKYIWTALVEQSTLPAQ
jgi:hypothetical protein